MKPAREIVESIGSKNKRLTLAESVKDFAAFIDQVQKEAEAHPHRKLPETRKAVNHKFVVAGVRFYATFGLYDDGKVGEMFIKPGQSGSNAYGGLAAVLGMTASMALQRGVPLEDLCKKWFRTRYEPMGPTSNPDIRFATSITDYLAQFMAKEFLKTACDKL